MATPYKRQDGQTIMLENPSERGRRYADELHTGRAKYSSRNTPAGSELSNTQKAFRSGYLEAKKESARIWCKKNNVPSKAKPRRRKDDTRPVTDEFGDDSH